MTDDSERLRAHRAGVLVAALLTLVTCCKTPVPVTAAAAANMLGTVWLREETAVHNACVDLGASATAVPSGSTSLHDFKRTFSQASTDRYAQEVRGEVVQNIGTLLKTFDISDCDPERLLVDMLDATFDPASHPCAAEVEEKIFKASKIDERAAIQDALEKAGIKTAAQFLRDPIRTARLIDLSPAVMGAFLAFSKSADSTVAAVADEIDVPVLGAAARALLQELVAEALASGLDLVLNKLEEKELVRRAAVSRAACALYHAGYQSAGPVTIRGLKRAILRFNANSANVYAPRVACADEQIAKTGLCSDVATKVAKNTDSETSFADIVPVLTTNPPAFDFELGATTLKQAATYCSTPSAGGAGETQEEKRVGCTFEFLSRVESVLAVYGNDQPFAPAEIRQHLLQIDTTLGSLLENERRLRADVAQLRGELSSLSVATDAEADELRDNQQKTIAMLISMSDCRERQGGVLERRIADANALGFKRNLQPLDSAVCLEESSAMPPLEAKTESLVLTMEVTNLCNPFSPMEVTLVTDGAFRECGPSPESKAAEGFRDLAKKLCPRMAAASRVLGPEIVIEGHTDEQQLGTTCRDTTGFSSNFALSAARADSVRAALEAGLTDGGCGSDFLEPKPLGESRLLYKDCGSDKACHAKNRRVTMQINAGNESTLDVASCKLIAAWPNQVKSRNSEAPSHQ